MKQYISISIGSNYGPHNINDVSGGILDLDFTASVTPYIGKFESINTPEDLLLVPNKNLELQNNDKYYFIEGVHIPRVKLKDIFGSYKIKTAKSVKDATKVFIGLKTIDKITDYSYKYTMPTETILNFINAAENAGHMDTHYANNVRTALEFYKEDIILTDYNTVRIFEHGTLPYNDPTQHNYSSTAFHYIKNQHEELYYDLLDADIYFEDTLMVHMNGLDAPIMNESMYESVRHMFESSDDDNWVLAMEIMANCNYEQSILYLAFLLEEYSSRIYQSRTKNHVNFKSFLAYMKCSPSHIHLNKDQIVELLIDKGLLTSDYTNILLNRYQHELFCDGSSRFFNVRSVSLSIADPSYSNLNDIIKDVTSNNDDTEIED